MQESMQKRIPFKILPHIMLLAFLVYQKRETLLFAYIETVETIPNTKICWWHDMLVTQNKSNKIQNNIQNNIRMIMENKASCRENENSNGGSSIRKVSIWNLDAILDAEKDTYTVDQNRSPRNMDFFCPCDLTSGGKATVTCIYLLFQPRVGKLIYLIWIPFFYILFRCLFLCSFLFCWLSRSFFIVSGILK